MIKSRIAYLPYIDGLRAIAIISIICFHFFPNALKGGFIGVDIFFVISGFLITTNLLNDLNSGGFSFLEFYKRRIKRIFPSLIIVLASCLFFGWFFLLTDEYKQLGKHTAAGSGFIPNIIFRYEAGYFDNATETKPLLHLWSLGIEEQFYILWPLILWLGWRKKVNFLLIISICILTSFLINVSTVSRDPIEGFFMPLNRFWEILCGSLLAWLLVYKLSLKAHYLAKLDNTPILNCKFRHTISSKFLSNCMALFGTATLLYGFFAITKLSRFPGFWALIPVLGTSFLIIAGKDAWINARLFSSKVFIFFGLISYPLYLWHWPLLIFSKIIFGDDISTIQYLAIVFLAVALSWITYVLVESRFKKIKLSNLMALFLLGALSFIGVFGLFTFKSDGFEFRLGDKFNKISKAAGEWDYPGLLREKFFNGGSSHFQDSGNKNITLFVGDSNIQQYYPRADQILRINKNVANSILFSTGGGCFPVPFSRYDDIHKNCTGLMETALSIAIKNEAIKNVVIAGAWNSYLGDGYGLLGNYGQAGQDYEEALLRLSKYIIELTKNNKKVFIILNIPTGKGLDPKNMAKRNFAYFPDVFSIHDSGISQKSIDDKYGFIRNDLIRVANNSGAIVINPVNFLCKDLICPSVDADGEPIYKDEVHLRPSFVRKNAHFIDQTILP